MRLEYPTANVDERTLTVAATAGSYTTDRMRAVDARGLVISRSHEAAMLRSALGPEFLPVTPGIRPAGESGGDHRRVATPREAIPACSNLFVVGRPIRGAADPVVAAEAILAEMAS